jgi:hypothetical protein
MYRQSSLRPVYPSPEEVARGIGVRYERVPTPPPPARVVPPQSTARGRQNRSISTQTDWAAGPTVCTCSAPLPAPRERQSANAGTLFIEALPQPEQREVRSHTIRLPALTIAYDLDSLNMAVSQADSLLSLRNTEGTWASKASNLQLFEAFCRQQLEAPAAEVWATIHPAKQFAIYLAEKLGQAELDRLDPPVERSTIKFERSSALTQVKYMQGHFNARMPEDLVGAAILRSLHEALVKTGALIHRHAARPLTDVEVHKLLHNQLLDAEARCQLWVGTLSCSRGGDLKAVTPETVVLDPSSSTAKVLHPVLPKVKTRADVDVVVLPPDVFATLEVLVRRTPRGQPLFKLTTRKINALLKSLDIDTTSHGLKKWALGALGSQRRSDGTLLFSDNQLSKFARHAKETLLPVYLGPEAMAVRAGKPLASTILKNLIEAAETPEVRTGPKN